MKNLLIITACVGLVVFLVYVGFSDHREWNKIPSDKREQITTVSQELKYAQLGDFVNFTVQGENGTTSETWIISEKFYPDTVVLKGPGPSSDSSEFKQMLCYWTQNNDEIENVTGVVSKYDNYNRWETIATWFHLQ